MERVRRAEHELDISSDNASSLLDRWISHTHNAGMTIPNSNSSPLWNCCKLSKSKNLEDNSQRIDLNEIHLYEMTDVGRKWHILQGN